MLYDLRTRTRTQLAVDPVGRPALQDEPAVQGEWAVWTDSRNSTRADEQGIYRGQTAIYARNLRTGREVNLTPAAPVGEYPAAAWIQGNRVVFHCQRPPERSGIVAVNLPST